MMGDDGSLDRMMAGEVGKSRQVLEILGSSVQFSRSVVSNSL